MAYVIVGHRFWFSLLIPSTRPLIFLELIEKWQSAFFESSTLSVEIFLLLTGVLVSYTCLSHWRKGTKFSVFHFYLHRYLRITPVLAVTVMLYATLLSRAMEGPMWSMLVAGHQRACQQHWWTTLLYANNYINIYDPCVPYSWFLSTVMQLYLMTPVVLIPLHRKPRLGLALTGLAVTLTTAAGLWTAYTKELRAGGPFSADFRSEDTLYEFYHVTHVRAASYFIGIALGYLIFQMKQDNVIIKIPKLVLRTGWTVSTFFILFSIYFNSYFHQPTYTYQPWLESIFIVFQTHMFALGVSWIIIVCALGYGGSVCKLLSWRVFGPLARLTYCVSLNILAIMLMKAGNERVPITLHPFSYWYHFTADLTLGYVSAIVLYLTVEAPFSNIASCMFKEKKK